MNLKETKKMLLMLMLMGAPVINACNVEEPDGPAPPGGGSAGSITAAGSSCCQQGTCGGTEGVDPCNDTNGCSCVPPNCGQDPMCTNGEGADESGAAPLDCDVDTGPYCCSVTADNCGFKICVKPKADGTCSDPLHVKRMCSPCEGVAGDAGQGGFTEIVDPMDPTNKLITCYGIPADENGNILCEGGWQGTKCLENHCDLN